MKAPSIDANEVAFYERMADQWWDRQGKFWPLHKLNELRIQYLKQEICNHFNLDPNKPQPLVGLTIIDIGCGGGILSESIAALGANVHGIDVTEKNILIAQQHSKQTTLAIHYEYASVEEVAERQPAYDVVLNMEVVEHVVNLPDFMNCCTRLLSPDGIMFIATINRNFLSWLTAIIGAEYILGWLPKGTHQWRKFVKPDELEYLLNKQGLKTESVRGVQINPFSKKFRLNSRPFVNYMLAAKN